VVELEGEIGLRVPLDQIHYVNSEWIRSKTSHWSCLFTVDITEADICWLRDNHPENEGEIPRYVTVEQFYEEVRGNRFLNFHYNRLVEAALILPLGRGGQ
jgi:hypothetical protein